MIRLMRKGIDNIKDQLVIVQCMFKSDIHIHNGLIN